MHTQRPVFLFNGLHNRPFGFGHLATLPFKFVQRVANEGIPTVTNTDRRGSEEPRISRAQSA
jgi:hypothetical protein